MEKKITKLPLSNYLAIVIILIATFFRLYNLPNTLMFQGDQGRDAIIVVNMLRDFDPVFIGPVASVGNLYLGPLYYYFMLPFLFLSFPSPLGPAYAVAVLGIAAVALVYLLGKRMFGTVTALFAATFLAFNSIAIEYSRFSWNPNPAPFVSILMIYFTFMAWKKSPKYWVAVAICFSVLIQLHYVFLLSAAGAGIIWLLQLFEIIKIKNKKIMHLILATLFSALIFLLFLLPLILFDIRHDYLNTKAFLAMFTQEEAMKQTGGLLATLKETHGRGMHILFEISIGKNRALNSALYYLAIISSLVIAFDKVMRQGYKKNKALIVLLSFLFTGILGTAFYKHSVFHHYILYLFPVTFLLYGFLSAQLWKKKILRVLPLGFLAFFIYFNYFRYPLEDLGWTIKDYKRSSQSIIDRVEVGEKYNIVLLSESKDLYGQSYRYFLETSDRRPVDPEEFSQAETLFIINENQKGKDILNLPIYEIQTFPNKKIFEEYNITDGPEIIILKR
ncbi:MAG: glycosyltransferase family 39 protein [Patescibacteria group bacterium]